MIMLLLSTATRLAISLWVRWIQVGACSAAHASLGMESPSHTTSLIFNRPGVAGAVLQTALSFIN